jgi:cyclophilin family peptidyl-prolyl cis-trans isomerase/HEAT repeat protein
VPGTFLAALAVAACASTSPRPEASPGVDVAGGEVADLPRPADDVVPLLLLLEDRRLFEPTVVGRALAGSERERVAAAAALGRIGDPRGEQALLLLLRDEVAAVRRAAAHALRGASSPVAVDALLIAAADSDRETGIRAVRALVQGGAPLERLAPALAELGEEEIWRRLAPSLALLPDPARLELARAGLAEAPVELRAGIALSALHDPSAAALPLARDLIGHEDPFVRGLAARRLGDLGGGDDLERLRPLFDDEPYVASQALLAADRALAAGRAAPDPGWAESLRLRLAAEPVHPDLEIALCSILRHFVFEPEVAETLVETARAAAPAARAAAVGSLLWAAEGRSFDLLGLLATARESTSRSLAADLLGSGAWPLGSTAPLAALLDDLLADPEPGVRARALRSLFARSALLGAAAVRDRALAARSDPSGAVRAELYARLAEQPVLALDEMLETAGARLEREPDAVVRRQLVGALRARGDAERLERGAIVALLERLADDDPSHLVRGPAADALRRFGRPAPGTRPVHSLDQVGAYREVAERTAAERTVTFVTGRGEIAVRVECPLAPKSCLSFLQLAAQGYYRGQEIAEREPGSGVRAGDPTGSGWGGPGYRLRDELTALELDRPGVLLLERPFPDGAAGRFELTLAPRPWRSGREIALGYVVAGLDVLELLRPGDHIVDVRVGGGSAGSATRSGAGPAARPR